MAYINKIKFECDVCDQTFGKKSFRVRHKKRINVIREFLRNADPATESFKGSGVSVEDWQEDPGELIFEEFDTGLEEGRTRRKRTSQCLLGVRRKAESLR